MKLPRLPLPHNTLTYTAGDLLIMVTYISPYMNDKPLRGKQEVLFFIISLRTSNKTLNDT
jgi:hypothetical protein